MYIFEYEKSELNMLVAGKIVSNEDNEMPIVYGIFYDATDGFEKGKMGYPLSDDGKKYNTSEEMMRDAIPYIFEGWKK